MIMNKNLFPWLLGFLSIPFLLSGLICPVLAADNKIGIHILDPLELPKASQMINANGGDWGYVTIVIREDDLDKTKWQAFMDDCRVRHVIPIVRLGTTMIPDGLWSKPDENNLNHWVEFLASLNWPAKQQLVTVYNEPNQAKEWSGAINGREYARILDKLTSLLKQKNDNFFILNAGLDQAAGNTRTTQDETTFLRDMAAEVPDIFNKLDGWASHSYPNHGFVGLPGESGKASIRGYDWELGLLRSIGLTKDLPVYITETGWPHQEGASGQTRSFYPADKITDFFKEAFSVWQQDERVAAVTPFVLNYNLAPLDNFSWLKADGSDYPQVGTMVGLVKDKGRPEQLESYEITLIQLADLLPTNYEYTGKISLKNTGQWIMGERDDFTLDIMIATNSGNLMVKQPKLAQDQLVYPGQEVGLDFKIRTGTQSAENQLKINQKNYMVYIFKPWDLKNPKVTLWRQLLTEFILYRDQLIEKLNWTKTKPLQ
jgi:hypothetical protein